MYDPSVFSRGQRYRQRVISLLAADQIDFYRLPAEADAGETVRRCFYLPASAEYCVAAIKGSIGL